MDRPENSPDYWRVRANEARAAAFKLSDPVAKAHMHAAADGYERLAKLAERAPLIANARKAANES
jgi:hypothetical protein